MGENWIGGRWPRGKKVSLQSRKNPTFRDCEKGGAGNSSKENRRMFGKQARIEN